MFKMIVFADAQHPRSTHALSGSMTPQVCCLYVLFHSVLCCFHTLLCCSMLNMMISQSASTAESLSYLAGNDITEFNAVIANFTRVYNSAVDEIELMVVQGKPGAMKVYNFVFKMMSFVFGMMSFALKCW